MWSSSQQVLGNRLTRYCARSEPSSIGLTRNRKQQKLQWKIEYSGEGELGQRSKEFTPTNRRVCYCLRRWPTVASDTGCVVLLFDDPETYLELLDPNSVNSFWAIARPSVLTWFLLETRDVETNNLFTFTLLNKTASNSQVGYVQVSLLDFR